MFLIIDYLYVRALNNSRCIATRESIMLNDVYSSDCTAEVLVCCTRTLTIYTYHHWCFFCFNCLLDLKYIALQCFNLLFCLKQNETFVRVRVSPPTFYTRRLNLRSVLNLTPPPVPSFAKLDTGQWSHHDPRYSQLISIKN